MGQIMSWSVDGRYLATRNDNMASALWVWDAEDLSLSSVVVQVSSRAVSSLKSIKVRVFQRRRWLGGLRGEVDIYVQWVVGRGGPLGASSFSWCLKTSIKGERFPTRDCVQFIGNYGAKSRSGLEVRKSVNTLASSHVLVRAWLSLVRVFVSELCVRPASRLGYNSEGIDAGSLRPLCFDRKSGSHRWNLPTTETVLHVTSDYSDIPYRVTYHGFDRIEKRHTVREFHHLPCF